MRGARVPRERRAHYRVAVGVFRNATTVSDRGKAVGYLAGRMTPLTFLGPLKLSGEVGAN